MKLGIGIEESGSDGFKAVLDQLNDLDTRFSGVELIGRREDGVDYSDIVQGLMDRDRDFFSPDESLAEKVAKAFAEEVEKRMQAAAKAGRAAPGDDSLAAASLLAAMKAYMAGVVGRIEAQTTASGSAPHPLTKEYANYKQSKYGFTTPIGKATGQLLAALAPGGGAAGKVQLIRK